tara:strand:+ start:56 stop:763 length:708 start_codon:yes stop_codon:yes gene_type:complete
MPKFPKNTGFKLPGIGSREINTPGNFRKSQKVEDVGYCDNTEFHMLPPGSSPLLARDDHHDTGWLIPPVDNPSFTGSVDTRKKWPTKGKEDDGGGDDGGKEPVIDVVTQDPSEDGGGRLATWDEAWENDLEGIRSNSGEGKGYDRMKNQLIEQGILGPNATAKDAYIYEQKNLGSNESAHRETHRNVAQTNPAGEVYGIDNLGVEQDKAQKALDQAQKQCEEQGGTYNRTTGKCN